MLMLKHKLIGALRTSLILLIICFSSVNGGINLTKWKFLEIDSCSLQLQFPGQSLERFEIYRLCVHCFTSVVISPHYLLRHSSLKIMMSLLIPCIHILFLHLAIRQKHTKNLLNILGHCNFRYRPYIFLCVACVIL